MQLTPDPRWAADPAARYGYFVLQARSDPEGVTGVLENLITGEKRRFQSSEELAAFVRRWGHAGDSDG
jgi:hypothetical protein